MRDAIAIVLFLASFAVIGLYWGIGVSGLPTNYSGIIWPVAFGMVVWRRGFGAFFGENATRTAISDDIM